MSSTYPPLKCKVRFTLEKGTLEEQIPWPPCKDESLWGELTGPGTARLLNVPFYAKGVSYLDEVNITDPMPPHSMSRDDIGPNFFCFESVSKRSGHATVRAILRSENHRQAAEETISQIERLGCRWESADQGLLSIDIPPEVDERSVMQILETSAFEGQIYVDVGVLRNEVS